MDLSDINFNEENVEKFLKDVVDDNFLQYAEQVPANNKNHEVSYGTLYKFDADAGLPNVLDLFDDNTQEKVSNMILDFRKPVIDIVTIAQLVNCKIIEKDYNENDQLAHAPNGTIFINPKLPASYSRFTIARELVRNIIPQPNDVNDYEFVLTAEYYARELLAPHSLLLPLIGDHKLQDKIAEVAEKMQVDQSIIKWQYEDIN